MNNGIRIFPGSPRTAVFTTRFVLEGSPITLVRHDEEDCAWQFLSDEEFEDFESVARVVAFEEIVAMDPTVLDVADMPPGHYATRTSPVDPWAVFVG